jgi:hypothetical protein
LGVGESKLGILGEKWYEPVRVHSELGTVLLIEHASELQTVLSGITSLERALSEFSLEYSRLKRTASLEANCTLTTFLVLMFRASGVDPGGSKLILLM